MEKIVNGKAVEMTAEEESEIRAMWQSTPVSSPDDAILKQISELEANAPAPFNAMKRSERQSAILAAVAYAVAVEGITEAQLYTTNAYYRAGKDLEDAVVLLRKKLQ